MPTTEPMEGIAGAPGTPGSNGANGSNIELFRSATHLQWRVVGTVTWADLIAWVDLKGDTGAAGTPGAAGAPGTPGANGTNGVDAKRIVAATGSTNASGDVSFTFSPTFAVAPHIDITITPQSNVNQKARLTAVSAAGCTVRVEVQNQAFLSLLGLDILSAGVTIVSGVPVSITATER